MDESRQDIFVANDGTDGIAAKRHRLDDGAGGQIACLGQDFVDPRQFVGKGDVFAKDEEVVFVVFAQNGAVFVDEVSRVVEFPRIGRRAINRCHALLDESASFFGQFDGERAKEERGIEIANRRRDVFGAYEFD